MFSQLKTIVDLIRSGVTDFRKFKSEQERRDVVLDILKAYFLLKDCVDDGEKLISEAGGDPVGKIKSMEANEAIRVLTVWDAILRKQGMRLYTLQGYIWGQHHLAVINPKLQERIGEVVGYKMDRAVTLHGIGACLFFRTVFPIKETNEEKAELVALMAGAETNGVLDLDGMTSELKAVRQSLDEYRCVVERLVSDEELLTLSSRARQETSFEKRA